VGPADEALDAGAQVGVCSTSNEKAVQKIVDVMLDPKVASQIRVFAGDVVPRKKPDPAIYHLAAQELGVEPTRYSIACCPCPQKLVVACKHVTCHTFIKRLR